MAKLEVLIGISGSGKSTYAATQAREYGAVVLNRDKFREMLFGYTEDNVHEYYELPNRRENEEIVTKFFNNAAHEALKDDYNYVIFDNTHLDIKWLKDIISEFNYVIEITFTLIDTTFTTAVERDNSRTRKVGEAVITKQFSKLQTVIEFLNNFPSKTRLSTLSTDIIQYTHINKNEKIVNVFTKPPCYIFDIDGTLANKGNRNPYDESKVLEDTSIIQVWDLLDAIVKAKIGIVFCSGRSEKCRPETEKWLLKRLVYTDPNELRKNLYMRKEGDARKDWAVKEEMWHKIAQKYAILGIVDDRLQVIRRANALGLFVFNVNQKNLEF